MLGKGLLCVWVVVLGIVHFRCLHAQSIHTSTIKIEAGENWWGGFVALGSYMPYVKPIKELDLASQNFNNQVVPLFLSDKGRYFWSDQPFKVQTTDSFIVVKSEYAAIEPMHAGKTLRSAYLDASKKHFPPSGTLPAPLFFSIPQYNTWIELMYNQNQTDVLKYAQAIVDNDFPRGVLMIDDNWQKHYGNFEFKPDKFADPKAMVDKLHAEGFKVMLWVCPFVSADSPEYRDLEAKGFLIKERGANTPAIIDWWNGKSACYDLTNPAANADFIAKLKKVQADYGVDGFKFDAGDNQFYNPQKIDSYDQKAIAVDHTKAWSELGHSFPFNEFRSGWQMGGQPLVERLGDKAYSWNAVQMLIPDMLAAGLLGYAYVCPDMIGGGSFTSFLNIDDKSFDQKLIIRSAQVHALMPMMQFSVAPWRILSKKNLAIAKKAAELHEQFGPYILEYAAEASKTGEPIVRHMEYEFPNEGFALCKDQFMLGDRYLVAPILTKEDMRRVRLPKGIWKDDLGRIHKGGQTIDVVAPLARLPYFEKIK
ncbi:MULTISPECIES: glycoside hydrolase family 31 protein [Chitinophagaceae]